ncbi:protein RRP6-like 2 [Arachis duranensis]|uniref:Protein RRP6-like 2 n=1 Tax=Arachis duranensis TaxID=130453 RepID=A0A6P4DR40_ARADU|nr:protein RRP6-like 2 [Arachis duranensis]
MNVDRYLKELSGSSQRIPTEQSFHHFYLNFDEFKRPIDEIARRSQSMLESIGVTTHAWNTGVDFPSDIDDAYEWVVDMNDELLEWFDESVSEVRKAREEDEEFEEVELENGFGLVRVKKEGAGVGKKKVEAAGTTETTKPKVSFHLATVRKPQDVYDIVVNNTNVPFEHIWLEKSEDDQRFIHPLEKHSYLEFVDKNLEGLMPMKPPAMECTPFKLVEDVKGLKELAAKLRAADEFAVDLEHNQYRSFQGLTCLMQISTRTEDFIVDTLKLRVHVGPYLREVFKDPTKKKVLHGADRDIVWLQRDFGIYVCNMFDTGQASRVLKLERFSLQYLLLHLCGVTANKEYQNADWRQRPLPDVMIRYGREDTHYLLYIYDQLRIKLFALSKESESSENPLVEVYKRSYDVCMQLYEKELLTEDSYLHIYGLLGAGFNAQQLAVVSGLNEWRDILARSEDESTGFILPNKVLLEIAKQMPVTISGLRRLTSSKLPYVDHNLDVIVNIVRHAIQNAAPFEEAALRLKETYAAKMKEARLKAAQEASVVDTAPVEDGVEASHLLDFEHTPEEESTVIDNSTCVNISETLPFSYDLKEDCSQHEDMNGQVKIKSSCLTLELPQVVGGPIDAIADALSGDSASRNRLNPNEKVKEEIKLDRIRMSVKLEPVSAAVSADTVMIDSSIDSGCMTQNNLLGSE